MLGDFFASGKFFFASGTGDLLMATLLTMSHQGDFKNAILLTL